MTYGLYQMNDMVNELEQAWDTESLTLNERLRSKFTPEQRGILILVRDYDLQDPLYMPLTSTKRYIESLPIPLLQIDKQIASLLSHSDTHEGIKIDAMVNKWKGTLQGNMATEIFVRWDDLLDEVDDEWWSWMTTLFTRRGVSTYLHDLRATNPMCQQDVLDFKTFREFVTIFTYVPTFILCELQVRLVVMIATYPCEVL